MIGILELPNTTLVCTEDAAWAFMAIALACGHSESYTVVCFHLNTMRGQPAAK